MGIPMSLGMTSPPNPTCFELEEDEDAVKILRKGINDASNILDEDHSQQELALKKKLALKKNLALTGQVLKQDFNGSLANAGERKDGPHVFTTQSVEQVRVRKYVPVCLV